MALVHLNGVMASVHIQKRIVNVLLLARHLEVLVAKQLVVTEVN
jgi:hypothetical protein